MPEIKLYLATLGAFAAACTTTVEGPSATPDAALSAADGRTADAHPSAADAAVAPMCSASNPDVAPAFGDLGTLSPIYFENAVPPDPKRFLSIALPLDATAQPDTLFIDLNKLADPFAGQFPAMHTFVFPPGSTCDPSQPLCIFLTPNIGVLPPLPTYPLERGTLTIGFGRVPASPGGPCRAHDADVAACDAATGCGYFFCSDSCQPDGTSLCDAGCWQGCEMHGALDHAVLQQNLGVCTTIEHVGF